MRGATERAAEEPRILGEAAAPRVVGSGGAPVGETKTTCQRLIELRRQDGGTLTVDLQTRHDHAWIHMQLWSVEGYPSGDATSA